MKKINSIKLYLVVFSIMSQSSWGQQLPGGARTFPTWNTPTLGSSLEEDEKYRKCKFLEFGQLRRVFLDFALENDVIASDDEGYTHGLMMGLNYQGDWGRWRLGYDTRLFTEKFFPNGPVVESQNNSNLLTTRNGELGKFGTLDVSPSGESIRFIEITDFRASYESRPKLDGSFYQVGAGLQIYTNDKTYFGGRAQQSVVHGLTDSLNEYSYGDILDVSGIAQAGYGLILHSQDRRYYCRSLLDAELNSELDRSLVRAQSEVGFAVCRNEKNEPIFELVGSFQCTQFLEGDRYVTATTDARLNLMAGENFKATLNGGVLFPLETPNDIFVYNDSDPVGRIFFIITHSF